MAQPLSTEQPPSLPRCRRRAQSSHRRCRGAADEHEAAEEATAIAVEKGAAGQAFMEHETTREVAFEHVDAGEQYCWGGRHHHSSSAIEHGAAVEAAADECGVGRRPPTIEPPLRGFMYLAARRRSARLGAPR
jgi:hypothetical protein